LHNKIQNVVKGFPDSSNIDLLALASTLKHHLVLDTLQWQSKQQLVLALSAIAVHLCTISWQSAVQDLLAFTELHPQSAWGVLLAMPEQLSAIVHTYLKTDKRAQALLASSNALLSVTMKYAPTGCKETVTGAISDSAFSLAMQTIVQWTKVLGMQPAMHQEFAGRLVEWVEGPSGNSEVILDVVLEVIQSSNGAFVIYEGAQRPPAALEVILAAIVRKMQSLLPQVQQMSKQAATTPNKDDHPVLCAWARIAAALVEAYMQILWVDEAAAGVIVGFLGACFGHIPV